MKNSVYKCKRTFEDGHPLHVPAMAAVFFYDFHTLNLEPINQTISRATFCICSLFTFKCMQPKTKRQHVAQLLYIVECAS